MEQKKTKRANVERQAGFTGNFFLLGLVVSIALVIIAFQWRSYDETQANLTLKLLRRKRKSLSHQLLPKLRLWKMI